MMQTDVRHDFKETLHGFWDLAEVATLDAAFGALSDNGRTYLLNEGIRADGINFERSIDFRYHGQEYTMTIPLPDGPMDKGAVRTSFDVVYERQYGHSSPERRVEMANIRLATLGRLPSPVNAPLDPKVGKSAHGSGRSISQVSRRKPPFWTVTA